jgi:hypothetical protein
VCSSSLLGRPVTDRSSGRNADTMVSYSETRGLNTVSRYGTGLIPSCFAVLSLVVTSTLRLQDDTPRAAALDAPLLV